MSIGLTLDPAQDRMRALRIALPAVLGAIAFRAACYAVMTALALWNEMRPAPTLPDTVLARLPYVLWVDRYNYVAWLFWCVPLTAAFLISEPKRWTRYMVTGGLISLARGACIALTGLGPPDPTHAGAGLGGHSFLQAYLSLMSPIGVFAHDTAKFYLTQDLFFSGHTATTFLLVLYLWRRPVLRWFALVGHLAMVSAVLLAHMHYSIDVVGAWAVTFAIYALREWRPREAS